MSKKKNPQAVYLGRAIACTRLERGMKRKDLVSAAGISYPFLAELENGHKWPSFPMLDRIAAALVCSSAYLLKRGMEIGEDFPLECPGGWCDRRRAGKGCDCWEVVQNATPPPGDSVILPCGCEWVGEFPVNPWLDEKSEFIPTTLVCGCQWVGPFPGRDAWLAQATAVEQ